jgi:hypothetical protein
VQTLARRRFLLSIFATFVTAHKKFREIRFEWQSCFFEDELHFWRVVLQVLQFYRSFYSSYLSATSQILGIDLHTSSLGSHSETCSTLLTIWANSVWPTDRLLNYFKINLLYNFIPTFKNYFWIVFALNYCISTSEMTSAMCNKNGQNYIDDKKTFGCHKQIYTHCFL